MNITLGDEFERRIANKINTGLYTSASEVIRGGLRRGSINPAEMAFRCILGKKLTNITTQKIVLFVLSIFQKIIIHVIRHLYVRFVAPSSYFVS